MLVRILSGHSFYIFLGDTAFIIFGSVGTGDRVTLQSYISYITFKNSLPRTSSLHVYLLHSEHLCAYSCTFGYELVAID